MTHERELDGLRQQAEYLQKTLDGISKRIEELESQKASEQYRANNQRLIFLDANGIIKDWCIYIALNTIHIFLCEFEFYVLGCMDSSLLMIPQ